MRKIESRIKKVTLSSGEVWFYPWVKIGSVWKGVCKAEWWEWNTDKAYIVDRDRCKGFQSIEQARDVIEEYTRLIRKKDEQVKQNVTVVKIEYVECEVFCF